MKKEDKGRLMRGATTPMLVDKGMALADESNPQYILGFLSELEDGEYGVVW